jgi:hypothetical protein
MAIQIRLDHRQDAKTAKESQKFRPKVRLNGWLGMFLEGSLLVEPWCTWRLGVSNEIFDASVLRRSRLARWGTMV